VGKNILEGQDFCFYDTFNEKFSGHNKMWQVTKNWGGSAPEYLPVAWGLSLGMLLHQGCVS